MEDCEALLQQSRETAKSLRRDQEDLATLCGTQAARLSRLESDLQEARQRIRTLETENAHLRAKTDLGAGQLTSERREGLLPQLVALRDILSEEQSEKERLLGELQRLRSANGEMEQQLTQLSPSKLPKKPKLSRSTAGEESRSYKSLYQKRRQQSDVNDYKFS